MTIKHYKIIPILILIVSAGFILSGKRFFPFSNYPMFMYTKKYPVIYAMVLNYKDGTRDFVPSYMFRPFSRLQINQMIISSLINKDKHADPFSWVQFFIKDRILKNEKNLKAITIEHVRFKDIYKNDVSLANCETKIVHTLEVGGL